MIQSLFATNVSYVVPTFVAHVEMILLSAKTEIVFFAGHSKITGTVRINDVLGARRVSLLERVSMKVVMETVSDPISGAFMFTSIAKDRQYIVIADDGEQIFNAAIADWVQVDD
ncbi:hypothetical protein DRJ25_04900 [Candidatus Woesearchaeota archaeon]|nr:MAG: hypothetical protein DRJ25_04900 [Candidatus Woesearchaeota archaeon]